MMILQMDAENLRGNVLLPRTTLLIAKTGDMS